MQKYQDFDLSDAIKKSLEKMKYVEATPIQAQAIPLALQGHDIMGSAQTGTGKTAAYSIPLVEHLLNNPGSTGLVLTPTRELGKQIIDIIHQLLGPKSGIKTAFIIGGEPMPKQLKQLQANPRLVVGTPGRINDHLQRGTMRLDSADFLVLDETDRMLDMGFTVQLDRIFKHMPSQRQTLMFSATLPPNILSMSERYMNNPKRVSVGETNVVAQNIEQEVIRIEQNKKYDELTRQLEEREGSVIVFVKTKHSADKMAKNLRQDGFTSDALHGDLRQRKRDQVMQNFRNMNFRILIATDIAARGLDVPHIEHVVNYDLPQAAEDFIHRMGRTARAGASGSAISFVSNQDGRKWHAIECLIDPEAAQRKRQEKQKFGKQTERGSARGGKRPSDKKSFGKKPFAKKFDQRSSENSNDNQSFYNDKKHTERGDRSDRPARFDRSDRNDRFERNDRPQRSERNHNDRSERSPRGDRNERFDRDDRNQRFGRDNFNDRSDRGDRNDRNNRDDRSARPARFDRSDRPERSERNDRFDRGDRPQRSQKFGNDRFERSDRDNNQDRRGKKSFSDRPQSSGSFSDRPKRRDEAAGNDKRGQQGNGEKSRFKSDANPHHKSGPNKGFGKSSGKSFGKSGSKSGNFSNNGNKFAQRKKAS